MTYQLPKLDYSYDALEPHIDAKTMDIHYNKHHGTYVTNLNKALESVTGYRAPADLDTLMKEVSKVPENVRTAVRNNGGGHWNHSFFWKILAPKSGKPSEDLANAINKNFESFNFFKEKFKATATGRFGSGWVWLCVKSDNTLSICSTPNQDNPLMEGIVTDCTGTPILGLDVWEHAYYLNYQNRRPDYIDAFWNIVNWNKVAENYKKATA